MTNDGYDNNYGFDNSFASGGEVDNNYGRAKNQIALKGKHKVTLIYNAFNPKAKRQKTPFKKSYRSFARAHEQIIYMGDIERIEQNRVYYKPLPNGLVFDITVIGDQRCLEGLEKAAD